MKFLDLAAEISERNPPKLHYTLLRQGFGRVSLAFIRAYIRGILRRRIESPGIGAGAAFES